MIDPAGEIAKLAARNPAAVDLARLASLAIKVEPALLRRLRTTFVPSSDASAEADLWFSALVQVRDPGGLVWLPAAAVALRRELAEVPDVDPSDVRAMVKAAHRAVPVTQAIEEELVWLAFSGASVDQLQRAIAPVLHAIARGSAARARDLSAWAARALPRMPAEARATGAAWQLEVAAQSRLGLAAPRGPAPDGALDGWLDGLLAKIGDTPVRVALDEAGLRFEVATVDEPRRTITVPATDPMFVEVATPTMRQVVTIGQSAPLPLRLDDGPIKVRTARGARWTVVHDDDAIATRDDADLGWLVVRAPANGDDPWSTPGLREDVERTIARLGRVDVIFLYIDVPDLLELDHSSRQFLSDLVRMSGEARIVPISEHPHVLDAFVPGPNVETFQGQNGYAMRFEHDDSTIGVIVAEGARLSPRHRARFESAIGGADLFDWLADCDLCFVIGWNAHRITDLRSPSGMPPLLILDAAGKPVPDSPGIAMTTTGELVRPSGVSSYAAGRLRFDEEQVRAEQWMRLGNSQRWTAMGRPYVASAPRRWPGDAGSNFGRNDAAIVIMEQSPLREQVLAWLENEVGVPASAIVVAEAAGAASISPAAARRMHVIASSPSSATFTAALLEAKRSPQVVVIADRDVTTSQAAEMLGWENTLTVSPHGDLATVVDALMGGARDADGGLRASGIAAFLKRRQPSARVTGISLEINLLAPPPKWIDVDVSHLEHVAGGTAWPKTPAIRARPDTRIIFVTGGTGARRLAYIWRWLRDEAPFYRGAGVVRGWSRRVGRGVPLDNLQLSILPWRGSERITEGAAGLVWRIEGANAIVIVDGAADGEGDRTYERALLRGMDAAQAGLCIVLVAEIDDGFRGLAHAEYIDLDMEHVPNELRALVDRPVGDNLDGWVAALARWGDDLLLELARDEVARTGHASDPRVQLTSAWLDDPRTIDVSPSAGTDTPALLQTAALGAGLDPSDAVCTSVTRILNDCLGTARESVRDDLRAILDRRAAPSVWHPAGVNWLRVSAASVDSLAVEGGFGTGGSITKLTLPRYLAGRLTPTHLAPFAPQVLGSNVYPLALHAPDELADLAWEQLLAGEAIATARIFRARLDGPAARGSTGGLVSIVGGERLADEVRSSLRGRTQPSRVELGAVTLSGAPQCLHVLGAPEDERALRLRLMFHAVSPELGTLFDVVGTLAALSRAPDIVLLQDLPSDTLYRSQQARERAGRLRRIAAALAATVPFVLVIPSVEHDLSARVLHLLWNAVTTPSTDGLLAAIARVRAILARRATGAQREGVLECAADLCLFAPAPSPAAA